MISFFEDAGSLGGTAARTAVSLAVPIPGSGIVLSPVASLYGEAIGKAVPVSGIPELMKDSVRIYKSGGRNNTSFSPSDQLKARNSYAKKAKEIGYNRIGQAVAAVDPGLLSIVPDAAVKKDFI